MKHNIRTLRQHIMRMRHVSRRLRLVSRDGFTASRTDTSRSSNSVCVIYLYEILTLSLVTSQSIFQVQKRHTT